MSSTRSLPPPAAAVQSRAPVRRVYRDPPGPPEPEPESAPRPRVAKPEPEPAEVELRVRGLELRRASALRLLRAAVEKLERNPGIEDEHFRGVRWAVDAEKKLAKIDRSLKRLRREGAA